MTPVTDDPLVELVIEAPGWQQALPGLAAQARTAARLALEAAGLDPEGWSLCLLACDDDRIAELNREFRGREGPTNVLSWPAFALAPERPGAWPHPPPAPADAAPDQLRPSLGDVALALQTAEREAAAAAIPLQDHVLHLILHGCLHLLGFDHETDEDAAVMEGIETRALARIGVVDPYSREDAVRPPPDR